MHGNVKNRKLQSYIELADKYGTPLYVYDFDHITEQFSEIVKAFENSKSVICYALKANSNLSLIKHLSMLGSGADCVSINEIRRATLAGIPGDRIIFSGVGKREDELAEAIERDILFINIESEEELKEIERIASLRNVKTRISIRVNPDVDPKTHPYISTGLSCSKFGLEPDLAEKLYLYSRDSNFLDPVGIHFHIGSQILNKGPFIEGVDKVLELTRFLKSSGVDIKFFDMGGGFGIKYTEEETFDISDYIGDVVKKVKGLDTTIVCEPGRFLVGNSGVFLTRVLYEKNTKLRRFVIVDGGMNDLIRPSLYGGVHRIELARESIEESTLCDVVGPICESGDYLGKSIYLPRCERGDILVVNSSGAYGYSMSSNYNSRMRPAEVAIVGGTDYVIKNREKFESSVQDEIGCLSFYKIASSFTSR